jgi:hypothetical protein
MAGTIVADTIQDGAGNSTAMDNAIYGSAKAWVNFVGSSGSVNGSYNVSSITRNSAGNYTVNFTNAMADANFASIAFTNANPTGWGGIAYEISRSTTTFRFVTVNNQISGGGGDDGSSTSAIIHR